jgi:hypothetical protein
MHDLTITLAPTTMAAIVARAISAHTITTDPVGKVIPTDT